MAQSKKMNEVAYAALLKELDAVGELIRTRQDEKQTVMDSFDKERDRYKKGRISEDTVASSAKKTNDELIRLDKQIRGAMAKIGVICGRVKDFAARQSPKVLRAHVSGVKMAGASGSSKKRSKAKPRAKPKRAVAKKKPRSRVKASRSVLKKK